MRRRAHMQHPTIAIGRIAGPASLSALLFLLMEAADAAFMGMLGVDALAGAALALTLTCGVLAFPNGFVSALAPLVARETTAFGPSVLRSLLKLATTSSLLMGLASSGLLAVAIVVLPKLGFEPGLVAAATTVLAWRLPTLALEIVLAAEWAFLEGLGDTRTPLFAGLVTVIINAALNCILIPGWGPIPFMGVSGSALATGLATLGGVIINARGLAARVSGRQSADDRPSAAASICPLPARRCLRELVHLGVPVGAGNLAELIGSLVMGLFFASLGPVAAAGNSIVGKMVAIGTMGAQGLGVAAVTLVARSARGSPAGSASHGAHAAERGLVEAAAVVRLLVVLQTLVTLVLALVVGVASSEIIALFSPEEAVRALTASLVGTALLLIFAECMCLLGAGIVLGLGGSGTILKATALFDVALGIPAMLAFGSGHGVAALYAVWTAKTVVKALYLWANVLDAGLLGRGPIAWLVDPIIDFLTLPLLVPARVGASPSSLARRGRGPVIPPLVRDSLSPAWRHDLDTSKTDPSVEQNRLGRPTGRRGFFPISLARYRPAEFLSELVELEQSSGEPP